MKKIMLYSLLSLFLGVVLFASCKKSEDNTPTTGTIKGKVTDVATSQGIANVRIVVYNSNTNAPTGNYVLTGSDGSYQIQLDPGTYYLSLSKQGYESIPSIGMTAVSITVATGIETASDFQMNASNVTNGGYITGKITSGGNALAGVLVVAGNSTNGYSAVSGSDGTYYIYNVPAGTYQIQGFLSNYNSNSVSATVTSGAESSGNNLSLTSGAAGSVSGTVTFLATNNGEVDVTLTSPLTKETIPGLVTKTQGGIYSISKVPDGTYIVRASYANDGYVVDPDWILRNGEPTATISGGNAVSQNFSVTGAVKLVSPTNDSTTTTPVVITNTVPTFTWSAYSSTNDYVIEVSDINGNVIWGGFTKGSTIVKNIIIPKSQLSIAFNSDGKATSALKTNTIYRWRIYASKDDVTSSTGWKLISVSEDQRGLFMIK
jgi:hypothetical protein